MKNLKMKVEAIRLHPSLIYYSSVMLRQRPLNSCSNTFKDSGIPGVGIGSPLTIAS
jgi:hypothetical protein